MDMMVGAVDAHGWCWLLVDVCDEQGERCSENSCNTD